MLRSQLFRRYAVFFAGLYFCAAGVALVTRAGLGTSPIPSLAYVLTFLFPLSLGTFTLLTNIVMLGVQAAILRRDFELTQLLQLPATLVFSAGIDLNMYFLRAVPLPNYLSQIAMLLLGCAALGFGVAVEVVADTLILPADGMAKAISQKGGVAFGKAKTGCDVTLVSLAILISLLAMHHISGVREGTLVAALTVGTCAGWFKKHLICLCCERWRLFPAAPAAQPDPS